MLTLVMLPVLLALLFVPFQQAAAPTAPPPEGGLTLYYDSFDGGGPSYTVDIEDETILSCASEQRYLDANHEELDGAGFNVCFTFTGLRPGRTLVVVTADSPILGEAVADCFFVTVDESLRLTCAELPRVTRLDLYRAGSLVPRSFTVWLDDDGKCWFAEDVSGAAHTISEDILDELTVAAARWDLAAWDGFSEENLYVLDGEFFSLEIDFADGTSIRADGNNAFPPGYFDAMGDLEDILTDQ